jgi:hypothetical protein
MMTSKTFSFKLVLRSSLLLMTVIGTASLYAAGPPEKPNKQATSTAGSAQQANADVRGTWSGTLFSNHPNVAPFSMTVVISADEQAGLSGASSLNSDCLKSAKLVVTVTGSNVVMAGSDDQGDNITVRGTVDGTGALLKSTYILNGSASGRCETDDGTVSLEKR